jgi:hypothetical protein
LPAFHDVSDAPPAIQAAAQAVVRVGTSGEFATGSFLSPDGVLLTNNHVLGVDICAREGCYAELTFMLQRHQPVPKAQSVFVVPLAVDVGLDMAVVQVYSDKGGQRLSTPHYLTIDARDPHSLQGTHVNVIGHPEGHLKKWSEGQVYDAAGAWIFVTAYILPGNSGSPMLDDEGHLVGLMHRGPTSQDLISGDGVDEYSIGTASAALVAAMADPLPSAMWSVTATATDADVVAHETVYRNARVATATVSGAPKDIVASLGAGCDKGLARQDIASPEDLDSALAPCFEAEGQWIECRSDAKPEFAVCPPDVDAWGARYQSVNDRERSLNGQIDLDLLSFAPAALHATLAEGRTAGGAILQQALASAGLALTPQVAAYLAAFQIDTYAGEAILDYENGYANILDYPRWASDIAYTALWLSTNGKLNRDATLGILQALYANPDVDVGSKLSIEASLYGAGALD